MSSLSVVILNWNGIAHLRRFLGSVVECTPPEADIVVADNGSTDDSVEWVERTYPTVRIVRLDRNYGFAEGYDRALRQIGSRYYILLNSDVEVTPGWTEPLLRMLETDDSIGAVAPKLLSAEQRDRFEYAGASGGFIDILGYPFCRGRMLSYTSATAASTTTLARCFGQAAPQWPAAPRCFMNSEASTSRSSRTWRR